MCRRIALIAGSVILLAVAAIQFAPARRINPPVTAPLSAPPEVAAILARSCADCHSNATRWPWYTSIAPISWLAIREVERARRQINFSEWGSYIPRTRRHKLQWMQRAIRTESMPPWEYRIGHPHSPLSAEDRTVLIHWIDAGLAGNTTE